MIAVLERTTVVSTSNVIVLDEIVDVIPAPPTTYSVSPPSIAVVPESPEIPNDVEMDAVVTLVIRPLAAISRIGIAVEEPYVPLLKPGIELSEAFKTTPAVPSNEAIR